MWKSEVEGRKRPLAEIDAEAARLINNMGSPPAGADPDDLTVCVTCSPARSKRCGPRGAHALGATLHLRRRVQALYDAWRCALRVSFQVTLTELESSCPAGAPSRPLRRVQERLHRRAEHAHARLRRGHRRVPEATLPHAELPAARASGEFVTKKSWSVYNVPGHTDPSFRSTRTCRSTSIAPSISHARGATRAHVYNALLEST